jgi:L-aspartate oxidase
VSTPTDAPLLAAAQLGGFDPRRTPVLTTDVLVIGGGLAGANAALAAAAAGASVLLLSKTSFSETNTAYAQGGIAAVLGPDDSLDLHIRDTLQVGSGLSDLAVTKHFVDRGRAAVARLQAAGTKFDTDGERLVLGREGGHTVARVVHADGTRSGAVMQEAMRRQILATKEILVRENSFVRDLLVEDGRCVGAIAHIDEREMAVSAGAVILATGGAGQIYRETTNPIGACADGVALAYRAGARVGDLEFVQFHPTTIYIAGALRYLISEVVRGAGAVLRDRHGDRVMEHEHPLRDLAPRDVVSRAILRRMVQLSDTHVYLDMSPVRRPRELFPEVARICAAFDIDIERDQIPVRPGAHYMVGGVIADVSGRTSVPGLYAVGETSCTSFHGANRLASNSLLEAAVMGEASGVAAAEDAQTQPRRALSMVPNGSGTPTPRLQLDDMLYSLKSLMWRQVGLLRDGQSLAEAGERVDLWGRYLLRARPETRQGFELANMLTVASLITRAAATRTESRGTHYRNDFPAREDSSWCRQILFRRDAQSGCQMTRTELRTPTDEVAQVQRTP